jgi:lysophospholipase L1-like esterase
MATQQRTPETTRQTARATWAGRRRDRMTMTAGRAFVIVAVALVAAALLTSESIRSSISRQEGGWRRGAGMALTAPLSAFATALRLDRPREGLLDAFGRERLEGDDTVVTFEPGSAASYGPGAGSAAEDPGEGAANGPPQKSAFAPWDRMRLLAAGDSLAVTPGFAVYRLAEATRVVSAVAPVDGRISSGLARPDYFDWFGHVREELERLEPDVLVFLIGGNDDQDYLAGAPVLVDVGPFGSASWVREYRRRVGGVMDDVAAQGAFLVWIGLPIVRDDARSRRYAVLNQIYRSEAEKRPEDTVFIDTWSLLATEDGGYSDYLPNRDGELIKVRAEDGVHLERAGGDRIARRVLAALRERFDMTSWRERG